MVLLYEHENKSFYTQFANESLTLETSGAAWLQLKISSENFQTW